jgi:hypothetical protein
MQAVREWKSFSSSEGRFAIQFPKTPKETHSTNQTALGNSYEMHTFECDENIQDTCVVIYSDMPANVISRGADWIFDQSVSSLKNTGYTVDYRKDEKLDEIKGTEIQVEKGSYNIVDRMFLVGNRQYQLISSFPKGNPHPEDLTNFLNSFSLKAN